MKEEEYPIRVICTEDNIIFINDKGENVIVDRKGEQEYAN